MRCVDKECYKSDCAKKEGPCKVSQGDCDALSDCEEGLVCGSDNCPKGINQLTNTTFKDDDDCCYQPKGQFSIETSKYTYIQLDALS